MNIPMKRMRPGAILPKRATAGSAGCDLYACLDEPVTIHPGETVKIPSGVAIALPGPELAAFVFARSGLGIKHNIIPANCVGVIDSDYRGEIIVGLQNTSQKEFVVSPNDRVAQLILLPVIPADFYEADQLDSTERNEGGFGSTGLQ